MQQFLAPPAFSQTHTATAEHIDEYGHMNNIVYLQWAMAVAWGHSEALGFTFADFAKRGCGFIVMRHDIVYRKPLLQGESAVIGTWISKNDKKLRLRRRFQFLHESSGATLAFICTDFVCANLASGRPQRMPPEYVKGYPAHPQAEEAFLQALQSSKQ